MREHNLVLFLKGRICQEMSNSGKGVVSMKVTYGTRSYSTRKLCLY